MVIIIASFCQCGFTVLYSAREGFFSTSVNLFPRDMSSVALTC